MKKGNVTRRSCEGPGVWYFLDDLGDGVEGFTVQIACGEGDDEIRSSVYHTLSAEDKAELIKFLS